MIYLRLLRLVFFSKRVESLGIIGPNGNEYFPSTSEYLQAQFAKRGAYRYMSDVLTKSSDSFQIIPIEVDENRISTKRYKSFTLKLINVHHGIVPALALAIEVDGKKIVISGDTNNENKSLEMISKKADLFIAHHAIPQHAGKFAKKLHMTPSIIAHVASGSEVKKIVLSHRMKRALSREKDSLKIIKKEFKGEVVFAEDRMRLEL